MSFRPSDRVAGVVLLGVALAVALEARTFSVGFVTDPVGPRALPFLVAALLAATGLRVLVRPGEGAAWPDAAGWKRLTLATTSFLVYAVLLEPVGFGPATVGELTVLSLLFGGRPLRSAAAGTVFALLLWVVFVYGLRLTLPPGPWRL